MNPLSPTPPRLSPLVIVRDAAIVVALSILLALSVNAARATGAIPLVAEREYQVLVPCPEHVGEAEAMAPAAVKPGERGVLLVDAREAEVYSAWHPDGAVSIPYDFLAPTSPGLLEKILSSLARRVVVYGDGEDPDSGEQLAQELSGKGIRNVVYVKGGAPALRGALTATPGARK